MMFQQNFKETESPEGSSEDKTKLDWFIISFPVFLSILEMILSLEIIFLARGIIIRNIEIACPYGTCYPRNAYNEKYWNGTTCVNALNYGQFFTRASSNEKCK